MSDEVKPEVIKKTQDLLGKYFKKPPLTDKLLRKPPFRFLQDIVSSIIKETGFLEGLFTDEELSAEISKDKEAKLVFLTKLIDVVKLVTGLNLTVRATKIISGHEPTKTNELLQAIGRALNKKINSKEAILHYKNRSEKKADSKKSTNKDQPSKKVVTDSSSRLVKNVKKDQRVNEPEKKKLKKVKSQEHETKEKIKQVIATKSEEKLDSSLKTTSEQVKQLDHVSVEKVLDVSISRPVSSKVRETSDSTDATLNTVNKSQTVRPKSVVSNVNENEKISLYTKSIKQDSVKRAHSDGQTEYLKRADSANYTESSKHYDEPHAISQNSILRETTVSAKLRTSNWIDVGSNIVSVPNIIVESQEKKEEAENDMVVIETNKENLFESHEENNSVTEEHGYLVAQILKTEQELVNPNNNEIPNKKVEIVWQTGVLKDRESAVKTVGNLRNLIQTLIKYTNPLGKVLDYLQGDMEIMQKELIDYRKQYATVNSLLEEERMQTEKFMNHMKESLKDIEANVFDEQNKIHQVKINISKNEHQIQRPVLKNDQGGILEKMMKKSLASLHRPKAFVPWPQLRKMNREERLAIKKSKLENDEIDVLSKLVVTGINAVTRGLEKKTLSSVLLDSNVESILIKHIVTMSENENIPVILIPCLKSVTLETLGFASAAFALKIEVKNSTDNHFCALYNTILELSSAFKSPKLHDQSCLIETSEDEKIMKQNVGNCADFLEVKMPTIAPTTISSDVYLYRSSNRERIFIPEEPSDDLNFSSPKEWTDYIPFGENRNCTSVSDAFSTKQDRENEATVNKYVGISNKMTILNRKGSKKNVSGKNVNFPYKIFSNNDKITSNQVLETDKPCETLKSIKRCEISNFSYVPLKIKRTQGNSNRMKATKVPKSKKK